MASPDDTAGLVLRPGREGDVDALVGLLDHVIAWLVSRGRPGQWGTRAASERPEIRQRTEALVAAGAVTVAEREGRVVGALAVSTEAPPYVPAAHVPPDALYVLQVTSRRDAAGRGAGRLLMERAEALARGDGRTTLALDHWAGAPELGAIYAGLGYEEVDRFEIEDDGRPWPGTVRVKRLGG